MCYCRVQVNGALVCNISDTTFTAGTVGFYSQGSGSFANASLSTVCDGGTQCVGANDGYVCSYSCAAGYLQVSGSTSQTCNAGVWSGSSLVCSIYPPTFYNQTVSVFEVSLFACERLLVFITSSVYDPSERDRWIVCGRTAGSDTAGQLCLRHVRVARWEHWE